MSALGHEPCSRAHEDYGLRFTCGIGKAPYLDEEHWRVAGALTRLDGLLVTPADASPKGAICVSRARKRAVGGTPSPL